MLCVYVYVCYVCMDVCYVCMHVCYVCMYVCMHVGMGYFLTPAVIPT